jgi:hypothetical protein
MPTYVASQLDELGEPRIYLLVGPARASAQTEFRPVQRREHPTRGAGPRHLDRGIAFDMEPSASTCESHSSEGSRGASTPLADGLRSAARIHRPVCVRAPPAAPGARRSIPAASIPSFLGDRGRSVRQRRRARGGTARSVVAIKLAACRRRRLGSMCAGKGLEILALAAGGRGRVWPPLRVLVISNSGVGVGARGCCTECELRRRGGRFPRRRRDRHRSSGGTGGGPRSMPRRPRDQVRLDVGQASPNTGVRAAVEPERELVGDSPAGARAGPLPGTCRAASV